MPRRNDITNTPTTNSRLLIAVVAVGALLLAEFSPQAEACTFELASVNVTSAFEILVRNLQRPVAEVRVAIFRAKGVNGETEKQPLLNLVTDQAGRTKVGNLDPGVYLVRTEGPGQGSAVFVIVGASAKAQREIVLGWPAQKVIRTQRLAGRLLNSNEWTPLENAIGNVQVGLWTAGVQVPVAMKTTPYGRFEFQESPPGIYILRVKNRDGVDGEIALELVRDQSVAPELITLHLLETSCGLTYRQCSTTSAFDLASRYLRFVGPHGAPLQNTPYRVEDLEGRALVEAATDGEGNAALPNNLEGQFKLRIAKPYNSVDQLINLLPAASGDSTPVVLAMHFDGVCSRLSTEKHATPQ